MYLKKILLLCLYLSFFIGKAQTVVQKDLKDNKEIMPEDHLPINGVLKNGFSYYLKPTCKTDQIELNLIVKAGSNQEKENQFAMAHFMEHMVLKAGKHINLKMRYESDIFREAKINPKSFTAKTELSYTSFKVTIPNNPKALSAIFLFYSDILYDLEFKQEYINSERSPFIDEHDRKGSGTSTAYLDDIVERKLKGSSSIPEDFNEYIWNIDREPLIDFYNEWYLPENTSLIITGNIGDISQLETKIKHRFSRDSENNITSKTDEIKNFYASSPFLLY
ncbi:MAG: insulinase family protein [Mesonia sp.]